MADRYAVPFQAFITNGAVITVAEAGRIATAGNTTLNLSTTGGAGTFTITLASGASGTVTSGSAAITGSVVTLSEGANVLTSNGAGTCTLALTLGTAANWNTVNTWSAATGGVSGASVPTSADNTIFNALSFTAASQILTVDATANTLDCTWTGAANTPTLALGAQLLVCYRATTFIAAMVVTGTGTLYFSGAGDTTLATNGVSILCKIGTGSALSGTFTLLDGITSTNTSPSAILHQAGTFTTGGNTLTTLGTVSLAGAEAKTLTLGASTITCAGWSYSGTNLTVTANTATIKVTGTGAFAGGGITTYYNVELNGTAHAISGTNTAYKLTIGRPGGAVAISGAVTFTVTILAIPVVGTTVVTITDTDFSMALRRIATDYLVLSGCVGSGGASFYAGNHSTDSGGNTGWKFRHPPMGVWK